jgi:hypothetical protein
MAVRAPPVSNRNRSCRLSTICASESADSCRGELDRERHAVEAAADFGHQTGVVTCHTEGWPRSLGAVGEQFDGLVYQCQ